MKKIVVSLLALLLIQGCAKKPEPVENDPLGNEPVEEVVKIKENDIYITPVNPTNAFAHAYNALSEAIEQNNHLKIAEGIVQCFAFDFYSLQGKMDDTDVGGLTYLPDDQTEEFKNYASAHYYKNMSDILNEYGETSLPLVKEVAITETTETTLTYQGNTYDGYEVKATITYESTKLDLDTLKTNICASVINVGGETPVYVIIAVV